MEGELGVGKTVGVVKDGAFSNKGLIDFQWKMRKFGSKDRKFKFTELASGVLCVCKCFCSLAIQTKWSC